jgi:hypothetical protein
VAVLNARRIASENKADNVAVDLDPATDIIFGKWDTNTKTFTQLSSSNWPQVNAVRIIARRTSNRGNAVPLMFAKLVGRDTCDVSAEAIVMVIPAVNVNETILATANPFLSGMPRGTVASSPNPHNNPDRAGTSRTSPGNSPFAVQGLGVAENSVYTFDSIAGTARHDPNLPYFQPDGELIADMKAPINALVGVFLDDNASNTTPAPANLDFSTAQSRNFNKLEPKLKQIFWIGDGKNSGGQHQEFVAPEGATRLFLATWDFYEWNNNAGWRTVKITRPQRIITVK